ncbi:Trypsin-7 [Harpegnathos saltator]|uniref:Trypsin-7 n=1 Tax=Harpegnathos saltator TaxID=610380 RepID=E2BS71_HARSA|nr:Trypsin-7 [Harpegnathos saltator]
MRRVLLFLFCSALLRGVLSRGQQRIGILHDEGRIVGGRETSIEEHPYQVSLRHGDRHACGGAIISEDWIITAAHCVRYAGRYPAIKAGTSDLDEEGTLARARRVIVHENYSRRNGDYDIAVIKLEEPLAYSSRIKAIPLASMADDHYARHSMAVVTGWGALRSNGVSTNQLRKVEVPLVSDAECSSLYQHRKITPRMLCAGYTSVGGKDACQGDSGGPLVQDGRLIGIVSWGFGCAHPAYPGVYTRIAALRDWIEEKTGV